MIAIPITKDGQFASYHLVYSPSIPPWQSLYIQWQKLLRQGCTFASWLLPLDPHLVIIVKWNLKLDFRLLMIYRSKRYYGQKNQLQTPPPPLQLFAALEKFRLSSCVLLVEMVEILIMMMACNLLWTHVPLSWGTSVFSTTLWWASMYEMTPKCIAPFSLIRLWWGLPWNKFCWAHSLDTPQPSHNFVIELCKNRNLFVHLTS